METTQQLIAALTTALEMEKQSFDFYTKAAKISTSALGKKTFKSLARDEKLHSVALREFSKGIQKKQKTPLLSAVIPARQKGKFLFGRSQAEMLKGVTPGSDEFKAYEIAMKLENDGYAFYKKSYDETEDLALKELFAFLLSEEKRHYELVSSSFAYLKDPAGWFTREEKPIVEG